MSTGRLLAVIPARGGSKGIPGKNIMDFAGLPLIAHSILLAKMCPEIDRIVVSTDSPDIDQVARQFGAEAPFSRPPELALDDTPMWPVLRHALDYVEAGGDAEYDMLVLLDPTSPAREPADITGCLAKLGGCPDADGIIGVSQPDFNPIWHCVVEKDGWMTDLMEEGPDVDRRQDTVPIYRINGSIYIWRTEFMRRVDLTWRRSGKHLIYPVPEFRAMSIDTNDEFKRAEVLVNSGLITLPWLNQGKP